MNDNTQNQTPVSSLENVPMTKPAELYGQQHHSHIGPILGVLVIMLVLILGGLYLWGGMLSKEAAEEQTAPVVNNEPETPRAAADTEILGTVSSSDELSAIEADVESTNLDSLDADLNTAEAELNAAYEE